MGIYYNQQGNPKLQVLSEALSSPFASSWRTFRARGEDGLQIKRGKVLHSFLAEVWWRRRFPGVLIGMSPILGTVFQTV